MKKLHERSHYKASGDWVFANDAVRPRWQETILTRQLKPAALRAGIGKIGWHTFRHTYSTMLRSAGTDIKVQQEPLRHANIQTTMNVYTQAVSDQKRAAKQQGGGDGAFALENIGSGSYSNEWERKGAGCNGVAGFETSFK